MINTRTNRVAVATVALFLMGSSSAMAGQIFGFVGGDDITLTRKLPPTVNLRDKRISLDVATTSNVPAQYLETLKTRLATSIQSDSRFVIDQANPATRVRLTATALGISRAPFSGTISGLNGKVEKLSAKLEVSFLATDAVSKKPQDAANLQSVADRVYVVSSGRGGILGRTVGVLAGKPPTDAEALDLLVSDMVAQITRRMAETEESISVGRPAGKLKELRPQAQAKEWVSLYDQLEVTKDNGWKADEQADRRYWMGVSKEAQAYETTDRAAARDLLLTAVLHYEAAAKIRPDKNEYADAGRRAQESVLLLAGPTPNVQVADGSGSRAISTGGSDVMTNDTVIEMVHSGMDEGLLLSLVNDAANPQFDLSNNELIRLAREKVPSKVIQAMRDKAKKK